MTTTTAPLSATTSTTMIAQKLFGTTPAGEAVNEFTLTNKLGSRVSIITLGGIITEWHMRDKNGALGDVVLGFDTLEPYLEVGPYFGALIGRVGNRIANAQFTLDGTTYKLTANNGSNNLHGGPQGFDKKVWSATTAEDANGPILKLHLLSEDGDQGFPGNLSVTVTYQFTHSDELIVGYFATTDKATPVNLTQHSYFNLAGIGTDSGATILNHKAQIFADHINAVNQAAIPVGEPMPVAGTPFDFREPTLIGSRINDEHEQIKNGFGYDHNFLINQKTYKELTLAARVQEETSGRVLEVFTEEPGVQFYSGNFLDGTLTGKGVTYKKRSGFCLEPQHAPDSINQAQFPSIVLRPGDEYKTRTIFKLSVK
ncbi:aldose epimerase family protein [Cellvibrio sp. QJXJ]|uniref:aldose epimerase family protein n=1 Tax=Cellvibrio sp. QJXJ TaxID=2964606 RepID=UPI0021C391C3|nr:aldose epimerase family protein [Cellvibrio sp. QJXJ]UUA74714.1 galactose mutarotase [Cellvibrio sp. QJXJ]